MRIAIIGAGFTGLAAALRLVKQGNDVEIFDASSVVGGLASGFSLTSWQWPIERYYHHIFANDYTIIRLSNEINWPPIFFRPMTSVYSHGNVYPFDSPISLLKFPHLSCIDKFRMGITLGFIKLNPIWKPLEKIEAYKFLSKTMGKAGYNAIWGPLLKEKFGPWSSKVNAAWFWARIKKRTPSLGYFRGGFQGLAEQMKKNLIENGSRVNLNSTVRQIKKKNQQLEIATDKESRLYDSVLVTTSHNLFMDMVDDLSEEYQNKLKEIKSLSVLVVVMIIKKQLLQNVYWLNVTDKGFPFVGIMEHTNMVDPKYYGGQHIVYLSSYLPKNHRFFLLSDSEVSKLAFDQITRMNFKLGKEDVEESFVFRGYNVQPIFPVNYYHRMPDMETSIPNLFLANLSMVYPWDRGTNYAVELGEKVADLIIEKVK